MLNSQTAQSQIDAFWDKFIVPALREYIAIPNKSPTFDPQWEANGHMERALQLALAWTEQHRPQNAHSEVWREPGRTPLLYVEIPATDAAQSSRTLVMYGHLDKQPEMTGWRENLGPWKPVQEGELLYGRGGADDGYALFASMAAVRALQAQQIPHARIVMLIEFSEESGSPDLPFYVEKYADKIGSPELVVCLDSGAGNFEQLWCTTSLRGMLGATLRVDVLTEGIHSGASGLVPSSFRIARELISRLEDSQTGAIVDPVFRVEIPAARRAQAEAAAQALGPTLRESIPWAGHTGPDANPARARSVPQLLLDRTWAAALSVTGQGGLPELANAGNVLRPYTSLKLSLRLPPTLDAARAEEALKDLLNRDPPHGATVQLKVEKSATGWNAPPLQAWLDDALQESSRAVFGREALSMGEGGTIPFMGMLGEKFPRAQFVVTGVLGPHSNAHGPNEFLHIGYAKKLTHCVAMILARHAQSAAG